MSCQTFVVILQRTDKMKAIIYARVSSTTERQNTKRQIADLEEYARYMKYDVVSIYEEKISGGKKNDERAVLQDAITYAIANNIDTLLCSELSRLGRNACEVLETVKRLVDNRINLYLQKEQMTLLDDNKEPNIFAPIMIATLGTCAQLERSNIQFRLQSGRRQYIERGGKMGRPLGSSKSKEQILKEYAEVVRYLEKGYMIKEIALLCKVSTRTVQRVKKAVAL